MLFRLTYTGILLMLFGGGGWVSRVGAALGLIGSGGSFLAVVLDSVAIRGYSECERSELE